MKTKLVCFSKICFIAALLLIGCGPTAAPAQSVVDPASTTNVVPSFFQTVQNYFTAENSALTNTFAPSKRFDVWTGAEYVDGVNVAASLGLEARIYTLITNSTTISLESVTKNAGIAGTILSQQAGVGLNYILTDTKITAYADPGYSFLNKEFTTEIGLRAKKALTANTYAGLGLSLDVSAHHTSLRPNIVVFTGFTF